MQHRNNILVATAFIALMFLAAIPMDWVTTSTPGSTSTLTGLTGHLIAPHLASLPIWLVLCGSAAVTLIAGLNCIRATAVPFLLLAAALAAGGFYYLLPFLIRDDSTSLGAGPFVAMASTFVAILLAFRRPLSVPPPRPRQTLTRTLARR